MKIIQAFGLLLAVSYGAAASASLQDAIDALQLGDHYRVLFVTTSFFTASNFDPSPSDINFYNTLVATDAAVGSITGSLALTWKALASTLAVNAQRSRLRVVSFVS